jgi:hypothetical protein
MKAQPRKDDAAPLRPVGVALAAVVAGLSAGKAAAVDAPARAPLEPTTHAKTYVADPTNHPGFEEDPTLVVGRSDPTVPFGGKR